MKKIIISILMFAMFVTFAACSSQADVENSSSAKTSAPANQTQAPTAPVIAKWDGVTKGASMDDLAFVVNDTVFGLKKDSQYVLAELGNDYQMDEAISCYFEGKMDKTFTYDDITVSTYPISEKDIINNIEISSDKYSTWKGIKIGDTKEQVISVYGEDSEEGNILVYYIDDSNGIENSPKLKFTIEDDKVTHISIFAAITNTTPIE